MSDEIVDGMPVDEEVVEAEVAPAPVSSLLMVMGDAAVPTLDLHLFDEAYPVGYYVQGKVPVSEAKVRSGARSIRVEEMKREGGGNRAERRHRQSPEMAQVVSWDEDEFFLNKCREQIEGFRLVGVNAQTGEQTVVQFATDKAANEVVYRRWLHPKNRNFRELLEDYLDWIAGRGDEELEAQFAVLGNA
jgi:hypothetical protein